MKLFKITVGALDENCIIAVSDENNAIVFDPGDEPEQILALIEKENLSIKMIALTHGHFDHIGAVPDIFEKTGAQILIHENDNVLLQNKKLRTPFYAVNVPEDFSAGRILTDGEVIELDELRIRVMHTPGHTEGSCVFIVEDLIIAGDTLFFESVGRTDLYGGSTQALEQSLEKISALEGDYHVICGHGRDTTLSHERLNNPYFS